MKIALLSNEYPPNNYGGAGVHVEHLSRALADLNPGQNQVEVLCFGNQQEKTSNLKILGIPPNLNFPSQNPKHAKVMETLVRDLVMAGTVQAADVVHCHTWYTHFAGCLLQQFFRIPLVLTTHSLEPHRPWKTEQLGNGYHVSTWLERSAYQSADGVVAVSKSMKRDVQALYGVKTERIRVIPNGISPEVFQKKPNPDLMRRYGIDPDLPMVLFVGRITRQKGVLHLLRAIPYFPKGIQVVLCAGMPDTIEIGAEMKKLVEDLRGQTEHPVHWIEKMLPRDELVAFYSHATIFICPSVYEPFGIINLEAMACGVPVVASNVGGIPEAVLHEETGLLVDTGNVVAENFEPKNPHDFSMRLAQAVTELLQSPNKLKAFGAAARFRVEEHFSWDHIAQQTQTFYEELIQDHGR